MKRYVAAMIRDAKTEEGLTEENFKVGLIPTEKYIIRLKAAIINIFISAMDYIFDISLLLFSSLSAVTAHRSFQ